LASKKKNVADREAAREGELMPPAGTLPASAKPPKVVIVRDLMKLHSVAREIGRIYRMVRRGQMRSEEGTKASYILRQLAHVLEVAVVEKRLLELERAAGTSETPLVTDASGNGKGNGADPDDASMEATADTGMDDERGGQHDGNTL